MGEEDRAYVTASLSAIDQAAAELSRLSPAATQVVRPVLDSIIALHGRALATLIAGMTRTADDAAEFEKLAEREPLRAILLLHGLHPVPVEKRARRAIERIRPDILVQGCHLGPAEITSGILRVRLHGEKAGEARSVLEQAILDSAPDLADIWIDIAGANGPVEAGAAI